MGQSPLTLLKEDVLSLRDLVKNVQEPMLASTEQIVVLLGKLSTDIVDLQKDLLRMGIRKGVKDDS